MFDNPRIEPYLGTDGDLDKFFYGVALAPLASQVEYVDAVHPESHNLEANTTINAFEQSKFSLVGTHLTFQMSASLAGEECRLFDVQRIAETNNESEHSIMFAECPAQNVGEADFQVYDHDGRLENSTTMTVVEPGSWDLSKAAPRQTRKRKSILAKMAMATGTSYVYGYVKAQAPAINASVSAAHNYTSTALEVFNVTGVTVDLVNENSEIMATTITNAEGYYQFNNVPESTKVSVIVKAEVKKTRRTANVGPKYSFSVRDNTSTTTPRKLYQVVLPEFTTLAEAGGNNYHDIIAKIGFDDNGSVVSEEQRQSAPFAILRTMKAAADSLEKVNANITMPALDIYWSTKNVGAAGDKKLGQIGTSHYSGSGLMAGLYILGKADSDTDEFDQGVIGHELGHYLQDKLSFSDSPGGNHSNGQFKDASLAYGEGYGTAIGALLSGSQYYCDVAGSKQTAGFCWDLKNKNLAGNVKGFYSEASIMSLMYGIGTLPGKGLPEFFAAVTKMKTEMHSATIFPFLNHYITANPDVASQVATLMSENNIKSSEPFGKLPAGTAADPAIAAAANKGKSTSGATNLEILYLDLPLITANKPSQAEPPVILTPNAPTFCINRNLSGANSHNGLGMRQRFTFTSNFDGYVLLRAENHLGKTLNPQSSYFDMREEGGIPSIKYNYNGVNAADYNGLVQVKAGKKYSLMHKMYKPEAILNGNECGYKVTLAASFY